MRISLVWADVVDDDDDHSDKDGEGYEGDDDDDGNIYIKTHQPTKELINSLNNFEK